MIDYTFPQLELNTLDTTTIPEYWSDGKENYNNLNAFVLQVTTLEDVLFPDKRTRQEADCKHKYDTSLGRYGITNFFAFNLGVLGAQNWEKRSIHFNHYKEIYRLRSKIIHGEIGFENSPELIERTKRGRTLICAVIKHLFKIGNNKKYEDALPLLLAKSYNDEQLFKKMKDG